MKKVHVLILIVKIIRNEFLKKIYFTSISQNLNTEYTETNQMKNLDLIYRHYTGKITHKIEIYQLKDHEQIYK